METPHVTNRAIAFAMTLGPLRTAAFRGYNYIAKHLNRSFAARTYFGANIECDPRDYIQRMIFSFGFWEPHISAYIQGVLRPGDVFVDVGANIGYYSLLAAKLVSSRGAIVAIEASPTTFKLLQNNLALNQCENAMAINTAASDRHGKVDLFSDKSLAGTTTIASRGFPVFATVTCAPLSEIIPRPLVERVRMIKLDIEGGEIPVMNNIIANLDYFNPRLQVIAEVSVSELRVEWNDIIDKMRANGFSTYSITNEYDDDSYLTWRTPRPPVPLGYLPDTQFDILFRRDSHS